MMAPFSFFAPLVFLVAVFSVTPAQACGGFFCEPNIPVVQAGEAIAFGVDGNEIEMHVQIVYAGPAEEFSWLLPVPFDPTVDVGSDILFQQLFQRTLPSFQLEIREPPDLDALECVGPPLCNTGIPENAPSVEAGDKEDSAVVLQEGSVGPFDFVVIEAANQNPDSVRQWLRDNNYDEYDNSTPLLNYYAKLDHKFVALRLRKEVETGDIQPIILRMTMPEGGDPLTTAIACIPIKLTAVAAEEDMPITAYVLGQARAEPINWFRVELDDTRVDWLGCQGSQNCYYNDLRSRFATAARTVKQQGFLTEYAGNASIMADTIDLNVEVAALAANTSPAAFIQAMIDLNIPSYGLVDTIVDSYIPTGSFPESNFCRNLPSVYTPSRPWLVNDCVAQIKLETPFDASALAAELNEKVFVPATEAKTFVDSYPYLTRMYAEQSPWNMERDPFFRFSPDLPDVSQVHSAVGVVGCETDSQAVMTITVDDGSSVSVPVIRTCGGWIRRDADRPLFGNETPPALRYVSSEFGTSRGTVIARGGDSGPFDSDEIDAAFTEMDTRVVSQVVADFVAPRAPPTASPTTSSPTLTPTSGPASAPASSGHGTYWKSGCWVLGVTLLASSAFVVLETVVL